MKKILLSVFFIAGIVTLVAGCSKEDDTDKQAEPKEDTSMENLEGNWNGSIKVPNQPLHIIVSFDETEELSGMISIPIQGLEDYPLSAIEQDGASLSFVMHMQGQSLTFDGKKEDETISGTFTQAGQSFPFELNKKAQIATDTEEEATFLSIETTAGTLYGELETPAGEGPYPVMIIIPGSGPTDRNGNSVAGENNSLMFLAEGLAENGIASVRYDKRGAGKNEDAVTAEEDMRFEQFIDDAVAWVDLLKKDEMFSNIGIIGHSQGSLVGMLAARKTSVNTFISIAGAGSAIDEVIGNQLQEQLPENLLQESKDILQKLKEGKMVEDVSSELQSELRPSLQPFLSSWMQYNPVEEIQKLDIPVLIANGNRDIQVPVSEAEKLHEVKSDAELFIVDKMNHVLKEAPEDRGGNMETYWDPELPLADGLIDGIVGFLEDAVLKID